MDFRATLLVLLTVLLCSSQGLTTTEVTEDTDLQTSIPPETSTETIPTSAPQENVSVLLKMMNVLNRRISEVAYKVIHHDEMNSRIMTRLDEMNSGTVKRFEENNSTMFSLFDKLDKKTMKNCDESLKKSEEMDNKLMKRLDKMNAETLKHFDEMDLRVKSLGISITNSSETIQNKYMELSQDMKKFNTKQDGLEARVQTQDISTTNSSEKIQNQYMELSQDMKKFNTKLDGLEARVQTQETSRPKRKSFVLFTQNKKNWYDANRDCIANHMEFASIESEEEYQIVLGQIKEFGTRKIGDDFWLSGTDEGHEGTYVWASTGRNMYYHKWHRTESISEPTHYPHCKNGEKEHCIELIQRLDNEMNDYCCNFAQFYICQRWS